MKKQFIIRIILFFVGISASKWLCSQIPTEHLQLWLMADSVVESGGKVSQWTDLSGNGYIIQQSTGSYQPLKVDSVLNNKPVLRFNGSNTFLDGGDTLDLNDKSHYYYIIAKFNNSKGSIIAKSAYSGTPSRYSILKEANVFYYGYQDNSVRNISTSSVSNNFMLIKAINNRSLSSNTLTINNELKGTSAINGSYWMNSDYNFLIGAHNNNIGTIPPQSGYYLDGDIAEILIYDTLLTAVQQELLEDYFSKRYSPIINLGADISIPYGLCDTTLSIDSSFSEVLWSSGETTHSLSVHQSGTYFVQAKDIFGRMQYDTINITFPNVQMDNHILCLGDSILLSRPINGAYSFLWSNGTTDDSVFLSDAGNHWLKISDTLGCFDTSFFTIAIDSFALSNLLNHDTVLCSGNTLSILSMDDSIQSYQWYPTLTSDSVCVVGNEGWYWVQVVNQNNCIAIDSIDVQIKGIAPQARFEVQNFCHGDTTVFMDLSTPTDSISSWKWIVNSTDTLLNKNANYLFNAPGNQEVRLIVETFGTCSDDTSAVIPIQPVIHAYFTYQVPCINNPTYFWDKSIVPNGDSLIARHWYINEMLVGNGDTLYYQFADTGKYKVRLETLCSNACLTSYSDSITVFSSYALTQTSLLYPLNNSIIRDSIVHFEWDESPNAISYSLFIARDSVFSNIILQKNNLSENTLSISVPFFYDTLYWKVKAYNPCMEFYETPPFLMRLFHPKKIPHLQLWLMADSVVESGGKVSQWTDLSGNAYIIQQSTASYQPFKVDSVLDNKPVVRFNGSNTFLDGGDTLDLNDKSHFFYIIAKINNSTASLFAKSAYAGIPARYALLKEANVFYYGYQDNTFRNISTSSVPGNFMLIKAMNNRNLSTNTLIINNELKGTAAINGSYWMNSDYNFLIGAFNNNAGGIPPQSSYFLDGDIAEILIYDSLLTADQQELVEHYLQAKYSPPVFLGANKRFVYDLCADTLDASDRFVSYLWSNGDTNSFITVNKSGRYWVDVIDIFGFHSADTIEVEFAPLPNSDITVCYGDSTSVAVDLQGDYSFAWSNGFTGNSQYLKEEDSYWIRVEDTLGCFITDTFYLDVDSFALYASLGDDRAMCSGDPLYLVVGDSMATQYSWSNGDTSAITIIENPGQYALMVTDTNGCIAMDTVEITIKGERPIAAFVSDTACVGLVSHITDVSTISGATPITQWTWHFENGDSSQLQNPMYLFDDYGYHVLRLDVTTSVGCTDDVSDTVVVYPYPENSFIPLQGCSGIEISFSDGTITPMGFIDEWQWRFGDFGGSTSSLKNPKFTYTDSGAYELTLITLNEAGCSDTLIKNISIKPSPLVDFSFDEVCFGEEIRFADQSVTQPYNTIYARQWSFGDGDSSVLPEPSHFYSTTGTYHVHYKVFSINGCNVDITKPVTIHEVPLAEFIQQDACANTLFDLYDNSTILEPVVLNYEWYVDDSLFSMEKNPELSLSDSGMYLITLKIETNFGCWDSIAKSLAIFASPQSDFTYSPEYAEAPAAISFVNNSIGAYSYLWNFGDGSSWDYTISPNHSFENNGVFTVTLIAINEKGCSDTIVKNLVLQSTQADIAIEELYFEEKDGFLNIATDIINVGTQRVYALNLHLKGNNGSEWLETWQGLLEPGSSVNYPFVSKLNVANQDDLDIICVEAEILSNENGLVLEESNVQNNELCKALRNDFKLMDLYPNPANTVLNIDFILPYADEASIEMYDLYGNLVHTIYKSHTEEGYHQITYSLAGIEAATYTLRFVFRDAIEIRKFVKY